MTSICLTESSLAALKSALRPHFLTVKSSHLTECIAYALGYRTHAALISACTKPGGERLFVTFNTQRLNERLQVLGYQRDFDFDIQQLSTRLPGLIPTLQSDIQSEKYRYFEQLIKKVLAEDATSAGESFNFADAEWVAAEARSSGFLSTRGDADLLVEVLVKLTSVSERVCREEVLPALKYRAALDTQSTNRLDKLIREQGWKKIASLIGVSKPTLEKLVSGGGRGPLFRHYPVQKAVVEKAREFLTKGSEREAAL